MISQHEKQLLQLLAGALHNTPIPLINAEDWEILFNEMKEQCVLTLPSDYIDEFPLNPKQIDAYWASAGKSIQYFYNVLLEQNKVISLLQDFAISVVVLKGVAAAMNYPHPEHRAMGDIDIIVPQEKYVSAYHILLDHGYKTGGDHSLKVFRRHISFTGPSGIEIELHHHFSSNLTKEYSNALDKIIGEGICNYETVNIVGYDTPVLPPLANGLVLLGHIQQHLSSGLGLRQIIDWMMYVENYLNDEFWNTEFKTAAERSGLKKLAVISTFMCQEYLGLAPEITWCQTGNKDDKELCDELLEYVVKRGNFGRKMGELTSSSLSRLRMLMSPIATIKTAQRHGLAKWKLLNIFPWLSPFAWIYQIIVWPIHGIKHGYTPKELLKNKKQANSELEFFKKMED